MENRFYPQAGSPGFADRDEWLNELQRRFSADLDRKSEVFNTNPHVEGCSSESDEEVSICRENNSSIYAPCSGLKSRGRDLPDDRIDDLYRIVKLHSQQMNLIQSQIQSLVGLMKNFSAQPKCQCCLKNSPKMPSGDVRGVTKSDGPRLPSDVSEVLPRCVFDPNLMLKGSQAEQNFFSTVMGTLRGILSESDLETCQRTNPDLSTSVYDGAVGNVDKTMLNATIEQLKKLGVSFIEPRSPNTRKVTFCESSQPKTESSVEIDSLARKYLAAGAEESNPIIRPDDSEDKRNTPANSDGKMRPRHVRRTKRMDAAFDQIQNLQKKTTDLSLATLKYLKRYKLGAKGVDESTRLQHVDHPKDPKLAPGKILDSVAIRNQPKLSNHQQWLK